MSIAVQTRVSESTDKAVTELSQEYRSMVNCGDTQYGISSTGVYKLNSSIRPPGESYAVFATTDFNLDVSRIVDIYADIELLETSQVLLYIRSNKGTWYKCDSNFFNAGLNNIHFKVPRGIPEGRYQTIKIASFSYFRLINITGILLHNVLNEDFYNG